MKICAIADLHGQEIPIPKCDVLVIAGDISGLGDTKWFNEIFLRYLEKYKRKFKECLLVFGNHDEDIVEDQLYIPDYLHILTARGHKYKGYIFWGSPYGNSSPAIIESRYSVTEDTLEKIFRNIHPRTDILITHCPPYGFGDVCKGQSYHLGSLSLLDRIRNVKPKIHIFGHIHTGRKYARSNGTRFYNVSVLDENYRIAYKPTVINIKSEK